MPKHYSALAYLLAVCGLLAATSAAAGRSGGKTWALLIGIDAYENVAPLRYSVADVTAVSQKLRDKLAVPDEQLVVMTSDIPKGIGRPTSVNVLKRLNFLAQRVKPEDTFVFYFSGHGFSRGRNGDFLGTVEVDDTAVETLRKTGLGLGELQEMMTKIKSRKVIFVIDACRDDPDGGAKGGANAPEGNRQTAQFSKTLQVAARGDTTQQRESAVLFACAVGQRAFEWPDEGHGAFTYFLLEALDGKAATGGPLTVTDVARYVGTKVENWAKVRKRKQTPVVQIDGSPDLAFGRVIDAKSAAKAPRDDAPAPRPEKRATTAQLSVVSLPSGAAIYLNGKSTGLRTPAHLTIELDVQPTMKVDVALKLSRFRTEVRAVEVTRGVDRVLLTKLVTDPKALSSSHSDDKAPATRYDLAELLFSAFAQWDEYENKSALMVRATRKEPGGGAFPDIPTTHRSMDAVNALAKRGIFTGRSLDGQFVGRRNTTRSEVATALVRLTSELYREAAAGERPLPKRMTSRAKPIRDLSRDHWAYDAAMLLTVNGTLPETWTPDFKGDAPVTLGELRVIAVRLMERFAL